MLVVNSNLSPYLPPFSFHFIRACGLLFSLFINYIHSASFIGDGEEEEEEKEVEMAVTQIMVLDQYRAVADYKKTNRTELDLKAGAVVDVVEKNTNGWWFINVDETQGWVPATYLEPLEKYVEKIE